MNEHIPVPNDIPLPLPASPTLLVVMLVASFVLHLLFVNLVVGGSILTFAFEWLGRKRQGYDTLAREIAKTTTVNKSLAVVLGVGPLLMMSVLYTVHFYSANALTGTAWISVIPLVTIAFLLLYLHKYSWDRLADQKGLHLAILAAAIAIFLFIPLIFLTNINLMLFPERWHRVHGFLSALMLPNVLPRYLHFLGASLTVSALFLVGWFRRPAFDFASRVPDLDLKRTLRACYSIALAATAAQFVFGPLVYLTLPAQGVSAAMNLTLLAGIIFALPAMFLIWKDMHGSPETIGRALKPIAALLTLTVLCMASGRHLYRAHTLAPHLARMKAKTETYMAEAAQARTAKAIAPSPTSDDQGARVFNTYCSGCHREGERLVGPPMREVRELYKGRPDGIVAWTKAPGKRRSDYPNMPPMVLAEGDLRAVAAYILAGPLTP